VTGLLARAALVAGAIVAVAWLAHGVRALDLAVDGRATLAAAGSPPDARAAERALASFRAASRRNPDPAPTLDEATLLLSLGRTAEAARVLEEVTRVNAGNVRAWALLAAATAQADPAISEAALSEVAGLYGRVRTPSVAPSVLRAWDGRLFEVGTDPGLGAVEFSRVAGARIELQGWAADPRARRPADTVLVVSDGRVVGLATPRRARPDLARRYGRRLATAGFRVSFPRRSAEVIDGEIQVMVFAASDGDAARIRFICPSDNQDVGC
jgi:hypothetical protein